MRRNLTIKATILSIITSSALLFAATAAELPAPLQKTGLAKRAKLDPRVRQYILPQRVLWHSETAENTKALLEDRSGQITLGAHDPCVLRNANGKEKASVLLDFGRELSGGLQIMVWNTTKNLPVRMRVRFGESASEAMSEVRIEKSDTETSTNDHAVRDQTCLVPWLGTHEIGNTGFRFARVDLDAPDAFAQLKMIRAVFIYRDLEYKGSFRSSDPRVNEIWSVGAYTVHLNMQDYLWDGVKRDRLVWIGDMHPETMTIRAVFGEQDIVRASLDLIREETPLPAWMNGISSYSMWWALIHHDWYMYTGDAEYLREQKPYLTGLLEQLAGCVGADGREKMPPGRFLDWPSSENKPAIHAGLHALLVMTLEKGARLCDVVDAPETKKKCLDAAGRLRKYTPDPAGSKQAAALMALAGIEDAEKLNREVMAPGGAAKMSTFYGYYVLEARAKAGDIQGALDCIRAYWGGMLDVGATTFWEDFDLEWTKNAGRIDELVPEGKKDIHGDYGAYCYKGFRHSLCHGWASGPTAWLSEVVLGIQVLEPGCRVVRIVPRLGDLEWAEGSFPTPMGVIRVRHEKQADGSVKSEISAPEGVRVVRE